MQALEKSGLTLLGQHTFDLCIYHGQPLVHTGIFVTGMTLKPKKTISHKYV